MILDCTQAVQTLSPPSTLQDLYHLVGLFNYYRDFIPNYAGQVEPLTNMLQGHKYRRSTKGMWQLVDANGNTTKALDVKIIWGAAQDEALASLKAALSSPPTLVYPDFSHPFFLYVDASQQSFAAALHQRLPKLEGNILAKSAAATHAEVNDLDLPAMTVERQKTDSQLKSIINNIETGKTRAGYKLQDSLLVYVGPQHIV